MMMMIMMMMAECRVNPGHVLAGGAISRELFLKPYLEKSQRMEGWPVSGIADEFTTVSHIGLGWLLSLLGKDLSGH